MYDKNRLSSADKDLILQYLDASNERVVKQCENLIPENIVPQGVSVFIYHESNDTFEYLFTKDTKYNVRKDPEFLVRRKLERYGDKESGQLTFYMHTCMVTVASKYKAFAY